MRNIIPTLYNTIYYRIYKSGDEGYLYSSQIFKLIGKPDVSLSTKEEFLPISKACNFLQGIIYEGSITNMDKKFHHKKMLEVTVYKTCIENFKEEMDFMLNGNKFYGPIFINFKSEFAEKYKFLTDNEINDLAKQYAVFIVLFKYADNTQNLKEIHQYLLDNNFLGINEFLTISSKYESFRRYIKRKSKIGLPEAVVHKGRNQPSNNSISELMKKLIVVLSIQTPTRRSARLIYEDIVHISERIGEKQIEGFRIVSISKIEKFMNHPEFITLISFAKDSKEEFRRNVTGVLRFKKAEAPLRKIYIDAYYFQAKHKNSKKKCNKNLQQTLIGIFFQDDYSEKILTLEFDASENSTVVIKAFMNFFKRYRYQIPREIVMDKFTYKMISQHSELLRLLDRYGLNERNGLVVSSNPNRKSKLERFFNTFQQLFMETLFHYIGPSVKANKRLNSHPRREWLLEIKKDLPEEFQLQLALKKLIDINYNKDYKIVIKNTSYSPNDLYSETDPDPIGTFSEEEFIRVFFDLHKVTVKGAAIMIKSGNVQYIYYNQEVNFIKKFTNRRVDAFVYPESMSKAYLFEENTSNFICDLDLYNEISRALCERNEADKSYVSNFNSTSNKLLNHFSDELKNYEDTLFRSFEVNPVELSKLSKNKHERSLEEEKESEVFSIDQNENKRFADLKKTRRMYKKNSAIEDIGAEESDTF